MGKEKDITTKTSKGWYALWREHKLSNITHWAIFLMSAFMLTSMIQTTAILYATIFNTIPRYAHAQDRLRTLQGELQIDRAENFTEQAEKKLYI